MPLFHALVLGIIQGLTEFLPISSSGHLILVPWLLGWADPGLTFDVALHLGTLLALVFYFWRDLWRYILAALKSMQSRSLSSEDAKVAWLLVVATIPGAAIGALGDTWFEEHVRQPLLIGILLLGFGGVLYLVDKYGQKTREMTQLTWMESVIIGFSQALALFPGVSRSGATISAGLWRGLSREASARFAFLLAIPITAGAVAFKLLHVVRDGLPSGESGAFVVGIVSSAVVGFLAIKWMLGFVRKQPLTVFVWYRVVVGIVMIALALLRGS
jgi:undecaprenyl-diphosphatase